LLGQLVLHLEQVGEVGARLQTNVQLHGLLVVVDDLDLFLKAVADGAPSDHRQGRVDVDRASGQGQKELHAVIGLVVDGQQGGADAVDGQHPARQKPRVVQEQAVRLRRGGVQVAPPIADDEGVAVENVDRLERHDQPPFCAAATALACSPRMTLMATAPLPRRASRACRAATTALSWPPTICRRSSAVRSTITASSGWSVAAVSSTRPPVTWKAAAICPAISIPSRPE